MRPIDLTEKSIGRWFVISRAGSSPGGHARWLCRCMCGTERILDGAVLRDGRSQSCGCIKLEIRQKNLIGKTFARLTVLSYHSIINRKSHWLCQCTCGTILPVRLDSLKDGNTQSCGCQLIDSATKHGHSHSRPDKPPSRTYNTWQSMLERCIRPSNFKYPRYGGRGITVCERWLIFTNFLVDMGERPSGMTIDRINNDGNYEPGNCRWATPKQQARNTSTNYMITYNGEKKSLPEWAEIHGLPRLVIRGRLQLRWSIERAFMTPYLPRG
jgi:hypothetical protein